MASSPFAPRPASALRPGPAWAWQAPRPFPALTWLCARLAASGQPRPQPALRLAPSAAARLDCALRLLFSCALPTLDDAFLLALRAELGRRAWRLEQAASAPRPAEAAWPPCPAQEEDEDLDQRRARLVAAVEQGLGLVEPSASRLSRPVRQLWLLRQARQVGQRWGELQRHPQAGTSAQELELLLAGLRRG